MRPVIAVTDAKAAALSSEMVVIDVPADMTDVPGRQPC
jgi:hypothetical protein